MITGAPFKAHFVWKTRTTLCRNAWRVVSQTTSFSTVKQKKGEKFVVVAKEGNQPTWALWQRNDWIIAAVWESKRERKRDRGRGRLRIELKGRKESRAAWPTTHGQWWLLVLFRWRGHHLTTPPILSGFKDMVIDDCISSVKIDILRAYLFFPLSFSSVSPRLTSYSWFRNDYGFSRNEIDKILFLRARLRTTMYLCLVVIALALYRYYYYCY